MSIICDSIAYGQLAKKLPRSTNTVDLLDLLLGEGGRHVSVRSLEKVLGYSTSTFRRAFEGRSQDDSILYMKYRPNTTRNKLDPVIVDKTREFIERKAPMKIIPPSTRCFRYHSTHVLAISSLGSRSKKSCISRLLLCVVIRIYSNLSDMMCSIEFYTKTECGKDLSSTIRVTGACMPRILITNVMRKVATTLQLRKSNSNSIGTRS